MGNAIQEKSPRTDFGNSPLLCWVESYSRGDVYFVGTEAECLAYIDKNKYTLKSNTHRTFYIE